jgi:hypothetical protein
METTRARIHSKLIVVAIGKGAGVRSWYGIVITSVRIIEEA